jgi:hypothetical protein
MWCVYQAVAHKLSCYIRPSRSLNSNCSTRYNIIIFFFIIFSSSYRQYFSTGAHCLSHLAYLGSFVSNVMCMSFVTNVMVNVLLVLLKVFAGSGYKFISLKVKLFLQQIMKAHSVVRFQGSRILSRQSAHRWR